MASLVNVIPRINKTLVDYGFSEDIGLLSIDIDGNDYWVWEKIDIINPRIVVCGYNSMFGCEHSITIPYDPLFIRTNAYCSNLYYGASLPALCKLAERKGYDFIGSNSTGSNAFFIRNDLQYNLHTQSAREGYIESRVRESRDGSGKLGFQSGPDCLQLIKDMPVHDIDRDKIVPIKDIM